VSRGFWGWGAMAQQVCVVLSAAEREQLAAIPQPAARTWGRARIVLALADRPSVQQVAQRIGVSRPTVWRWQQRFAESLVGIISTVCRDQAFPPAGSSGAIEPRFGHHRRVRYPARNQDINAHSGAVEVLHHDRAKRPECRLGGPIGRGARR
jgi:hypothetical protein